jgi:hypothetical protein
MSAARKLGLHTLHAKIEERSPVLGSEIIINVF